VKDQIGVGKIGADDVNASITAYGAVTWNEFTVLVEQPIARVAHIVALLPYAEDDWQAVRNRHQNDLVVIVEVGLIDAPRDPHVAFDDWPA